MILHLSDLYNNFCNYWRDGQCELFPQEEIQQWEERMNPRRVVAEVHAELFPDHVNACPNCGQFNVKVSDDWSFCRSESDVECI